MIYFYGAERGVIVAVTQNGKENSDSELETGEASEGSQEQCNTARMQATSNVVDGRHNVGTQLQGGFIDTSSVPSLFKDYMTKFRLSLKSQNNLSLLIVAIFALIFFMQVRTLNHNFNFFFFLFMLCGLIMTFCQVLLTDSTYCVGY